MPGPGLFGGGIPRLTTGVGAPGVATLQAGIVSNIGDSYYDTTVAVAVPYTCVTGGLPGTSVWTLVSTGGAAPALVNTVAWVKAAPTITVSGAAVTSVTFSGLTGDTDGGYMILGRIHNVNGVGSTIGVRPNNYSGGDYVNYGVTVTRAGVVGVANADTSALAAGLDLSNGGASTDWGSFIWTMPVSISTNPARISISHYFNGGNPTGVNYLSVGGRYVPTDVFASLVVVALVGTAQLGIGSTFELYRKAIPS